MHSSNSLPVSRVIRLLEPFAGPVSVPVAQDFLLYLDLLRAWNQKISLTTVEDPEEILEFHFGESLFGARVGDVEKGRLADVGSGAGFPGLPLAIANGKLDVTLIEPNAKKATFLAEVIRRLSVKNAGVQRSRVPEIGTAAKFDFIAARALGDYDRLLGWAAQSLLPSGRAILWLGKADAVELIERADWQWQPLAQVPRSRERVVLVGSPLPGNVPRGT